MAPALHTHAWRTCHYYGRRICNIPWKGAALFTYGLPEYDVFVIDLSPFFIELYGFTRLAVCFWWRDIGGRIIVSTCIWFVYNYARSVAWGIAPFSGLFGVGAGAGAVSCSTSAVRALDPDFSLVFCGVSGVPDAAFSVEACAVLI